MLTLVPPVILIDDLDAPVDPLSGLDGSRSCFCRIRRRRAGRRIRRKRKRDAGERRWLVALASPYSAIRTTRPRTKLNSSLRGAEGDVAISGGGGSIAKRLLRWRSQ